MADTPQTAAKPDDKFKSFLSSMNIASPEQQGKEFEAIEAKRREQAEKDLDASRMITKRTQLLNDAMAKIKTPEAPTFQDMPDAPQPEMRDPMQALGSVGSVLAVFGSLRTRQPMTAALNSMAASMKGFHEGDKERVKLEREKWHDNMTKALRQNQLEVQRYSLALQKAGFDMEKFQAEGRAIAAEAQDMQMLAAFHEKNFQAQSALLNAKMNAGYKAADLFMGQQQFEEQQKTRRAQIAATAAAHADAVEDRKLRREELQAHQQLQRADANTKWFVSSAQRQVKPYQENIRKADEIDANLVVGNEMPDTVKASVKQFAGAKGQMARWTQGLDRYTGDTITRIFSQAEKGIFGKMSQQDVDAMKKFVANVRAADAQAVEKIKESYRPMQREFKISDGIFDIPFRAGAPDVGLPGADPAALRALGIDPDAAAADIVDGMVK